MAKQETLNDQHRQFVTEYLIDFNATQAAIRAGYSKKTAYSQGQRLLKHAEVQKALAAAKEARAERTTITAAMVKGGGKSPRRTPMR